MVDIHGMVKGFVSISEVDNINEEVVGHGLQEGRETLRERPVSPVN